PIVALNRCRADRFGFRPLRTRHENKDNGCSASLVQRIEGDFVLRLFPNRLLAAGCALAAVCAIAPNRAAAQYMPYAGQPNSFAQTNFAPQPEVIAAPPAASPMPMAPPQSFRLTLDDARARAMANNKAIALARLNIDEKRFATDAARKDYFP